MTKSKEKRTESMNQAEKSNEKSSKNKQKLAKIPTLEFDQSAGFICDVDTGICGPVKSKNLR